jgi:signal transduction histidine kinase
VRDPSLGAVHIERAKDIARTSLQEARRSVWNLLPRALEEQGLEEAIRQAVDAFSDAGGARATLEVEGDPCVATLEVEGASCTLPSDVQVALLRIVQEALTNVRKHASARSVAVRLTYARDSVSVTVADDGNGIDREAALRSAGRGGGFGVQAMTQRARILGGTLEFGPRPGGGTQVQAHIPLRDSGPAATAAPRVAQPQS